MTKMTDERLANERLRQLLIKVGKQAERINELEEDNKRLKGWIKTHTQASGKVVHEYIERISELEAENTNLRELLDATDTLGIRGKGALEDD